MQTILFNSFYTSNDDTKNKKYAFCREKYIINLYSIADRLFFVIYRWNGILSVENSVWPYRRREHYILYANCSCNSCWALTREFKSKKNDSNWSWKCARKIGVNVNRSKFFRLAKCDENSLRILVESDFLDVFFKLWKLFKFDMKPLASKCMTVTISFQKSQLNDEPENADSNHLLGYNSS